MKDVIHKPLDYQNLKRIILLYHFGLTESQFEEYTVEEAAKQKAEIEMCQNI